jgi:plasmid stabilization system protein ParE
MKVYKVVLTETASECLLNIAECLALDHPIRAESFFEETVGYLRKTLSTLPLTGKVYEEMEAKIQVRSLPFQNYVIFYRLRGDAAEVLFIFNSAHNIKNILTSLAYPLT